MNTYPHHQTLIGLSFCCIILFAGCGEDQPAPQEDPVDEPLSKEAIETGEKLVAANSLKAYLPLGNHRATFYSYTWSGRIRKAGNGSISIDQNVDTGLTIVELKDHRGVENRFELPKDLSFCDFLNERLPAAQTAFERKDRGTLDSRVNREWKNEILTVLVGRTLRDNMNVIYLDNRIDADIFMIAKFVPYRFQFLDL